MSEPILPLPVVSRNQPQQTGDSISVSSIASRIQTRGTTDQPQPPSLKTSVENTSCLEQSSSTTTDTLVDDTYEYPRFRYKGWKWPAGSYLSYVEHIAKGFPDLESILDGWGNPKKVDIMILDIKVDGTCSGPKIFGESDSINRYTNSLESHTVKHNYTTLKDFLKESKPPDVAARLILVEDLSLAMIEALGSALDLNPFFFAQHLARTERMISPNEYRNRQFNGGGSYNKNREFRGSPKGAAKLENFFCSSWIRGIDLSPDSRLAEGLKNNLYRPYLNLGYAEYAPPHFEKVFPGAAEEQISFLYRNDHHGWTGIFLFDPIREKSKFIYPTVAVLYKNQGQNNQPVPSFNQFTISPKTYMEESFKDPSTRNQFANYIIKMNEAGVESRKCACDISMNVSNKSTVLHQIFHFMLEDLENVLWKLEQFFDEIDTGMANNEILKTQLTTWRMAFGDINIYLPQAHKNISSLLGAVVVGGHEFGKLEPAFKTVSSRIKDLTDRAERSFGALMSSMAIVESQRAISQAESISRLTELAFFFIPLSFATSVFGMQIPSWSENYRPYMWFVTSICLVLGVYLFRIIVRSTNF